MTAANSAGLDHICGISADVSLIIKTDGSALPGNTRLRGCLPNPSEPTPPAYAVGTVPWICGFTYPSFGMSFAPAG